MHTEAVTSHAALTGSPRVSATTAKDIAPRMATPAQRSFACSDINLLPRLIGTAKTLHAVASLRPPSSGRMVTQRPSLVLMTKQIARLRIDPDQPGTNPIR